MSDASPPSYDVLYPSIGSQHVSVGVTDRTGLLSRQSDGEGVRVRQDLQGKYSAAKAYIVLLLVLAAAGAIAVVTLAWPRTVFPCVPYTCTWAVYKGYIPHQGSPQPCTNITSTPGGAGPDQQECLYGVDIGYGQGGYPWQYNFDSDSRLVSTAPLNSYYTAPPYSPRTCYHPSPLNPDSWAYCGGEYEPNWINDFDCNPVFQCTPESTLSSGAAWFAGVTSVVAGVLFITASVMCFVPEDKK